MNISILGDGGWGTAMACYLSQKNFNVKLWGPFEENINYINKHRTNPTFLKGITLPDNITCTANLSEALKSCNIIVLALPSQFIRNLLQDIKPYFKPTEHRIVNLAKGIENNTQMRISEIVKEVLGEASYTVLSGPSHAEEVANAVPSAVVAASKNIDEAIFIQNTFISDKFRIYCSDDVTGVELSGSLKNVYAIAAGISDGLNLGDNSKAALMTRSIAEMSRLGTSLGGQFETFSGLSGIGDLIVTCCSKHSRNRFVGEELGKGRNLDAITKAMNMVIAEGVKTTKSAYNLIQKNNVDAPIINELYQILYKSKNPRESLTSLMNREAKHETY